MFLFAMNVWWFHFIILLIYRVATGQSTEVEDTREVGTLEVHVTKRLRSIADTTRGHHLSPPPHHNNV